MVALLLQLLPVSSGIKMKRGHVQMVIFLSPRDFCYLLEKI